MVLFMSNTYSFNKKPMNDKELLNGYSIDAKASFENPKKLYIVMMNAKLSNGKLLVADPSIIGDFRLHVQLFC